MYSAMVIGCQYYRFPTHHKPLIFTKHTVMLFHEMTQLRNSWLIADIGATTSRCAILDHGRIGEVQRFHNDDANGVGEILSRYLSLSNRQPNACALAVAAPVDGEEFRMINRDWRFNRSELAVLGLDRVEVLNDFHAVAYALPVLNDATRAEIGKATQYRDGNIAVLGPGSGLGMSAWISGATAMFGEGGHITVAGRNSAEDEIIVKLRDRFGHCSAERILSGPGLIALHEAMHGKRLAAPEEVTSDPEEPNNAATLRQFFRFLGSTAAELALITGAYGGVYIAGGIVPACLDQIVNSDFRTRFEDKNRYRDYMRAIPTWVVTDPYPGLTGLAEYIASNG
jgi:glucokinase